MEVILVIVIVAALLLMGGPLYAAQASLATPRIDLANGMQELADEEGKYIAGQVAPDQTVEKSTATYPVRPREDAGRLEARTGLRGVDGTYPRGTIAWDERTYTCKEYGFEVSKDDRQLRQFASDYGLDIDEAAARWCYFQVLKQREKRVADAVMDATTNFTAGQGNYTDVSATPWTTTSTDILVQIQNAQAAVQALTGEVPMSLALSYKRFQNLINNDDIVGKIGNTRDKTVQAIAAVVAPMLGLSELLVGYGVYNSAAEGAAWSGTRFWSETYANLFVKRTSIEQPGLILSLRYAADSPQVIVVEEYRDERSRASIVRARQTVTEELADVLYGHLLKVV